MNDEAGRQKAEEGRVEAEDERVEHEEERRVAEGGEQSAVEKGRVEAEGVREASETDRVIAEEKRGSVRAFYVKLATFVALPIAFIALLPALVGIYLIDQYAEESRTQVFAACQDIEGLKAGHRAEAIQAFQRLDERLSLIGIDRTVKVVAIAERNRDETLKRYAARDCQVP